MFEDRTNNQAMPATRAEESNRIKFHFRKEHADKEKGHVNYENSGTYYYYYYYYYYYHDHYNNYYYY